MSKSKFSKSLFNLLFVKYNKNYDIFHKKTTKLSQFKVFLV
jgi:hypothetical protein